MLNNPFVHGNDQFNAANQHRFNHISYHDKIQLQGMIFLGMRKRRKAYLSRRARRRRNLESPGREKQGIRGIPKIVLRCLRCRYIRGLDRHGGRIINDRNVSADIAEEGCRRQAGRAHGEGERLAG